MEVGEGDEHAHLVAHRSDLIAMNGHSSQTGADRARALVERLKSSRAVSSCAGVLSVAWRDQKVRFCSGVNGKQSMEQGGGIRGSC